MSSVYYTGNSGRSTGPHLDFRVFNPKSGNYEDPSKYTSYLTTDGGKAFNFEITSGFGPRNAPTAGASTDHKGIDYATPVGTALTIDGKHLSTWDDEGGGGRMSQYVIQTEDGPRELLLLHGNENNKVTGKGAITDYDIDSLFDTPTHDADGTPKSDNGGPKDKAQEGLTEAVRRVKTAKEAVADLGNDFGSMKSNRLGSALSGAQEAIIAARMDAGESFGYVTEQKPITKNEGTDDTPDPPSTNPTKSRIIERIKKQADAPAK